MFTESLEIKRFPIDEELVAHYLDRPESHRLSVNIHHSCSCGNANLEGVELAKIVTHGPRPP